MKSTKNGTLGTPTQSNLPTREDFQAMVDRANAGDAQALADLRQTLDEHPEIWRAVGDLAVHARSSMIRLVANGDQLLAESLLRKADEMEQELGGLNPSPLERLAVQRIVACWLELEFTDGMHPMPAGETLKQAKFSLEVKAAAQRRFQAAVKSLTLIRKMVPGNMPLGTPASTPVPIFDLLRNGVACRKGNGHSKPRLNGKAALPGTATEMVIPINRIRRFGANASDLVHADEN